MPPTITTTIRLTPATKRRLSRAARARGLSLNRYFITTAEEAADAPPMSGLGRELEKMAIDAMGLAALASMRAHAKRTGLDRMTDHEIIDIVNDTRRRRREAASYTATAAVAA